MNPTQVVSNQAQAFAAGTWDGEFHPEFGPRDGDVVVLEHWAQSGFANTDLDAQLTQRGIEKIYLFDEDIHPLGRRERQAPCVCR